MQKKNSFHIFSVIGLFFFLAACSSVVTERPMLIAHRGLSELYPESTEPAYLEALKAHKAVLEADIQRSRDGVLFVFHDNSFERTSNIADVFPGREEDPVGSFSFAEILQLDLGTWFNREKPDFANPEFSGLTVLSFEELLLLADRHEQPVVLYLESKSPELYPGVEEQMLAVLKKHNWTAHGTEASNKTVFLQSFSIDSLIRFSELDPSYDRTLLLSWRLIYQPLRYSRLLRQARDYATGLGPNKLLVTSRFVRKAQADGLYVHTYTVNTERDLLKYKNRGVDGLFTDNVLRLQTYLGE